MYTNYTVNCTHFIQRSAQTIKFFIITLLTLKIQLINALLCRTIILVMLLILL